jgi:ubiquitin-like protein Pup
MTDRDRATPRKDVEDDVVEDIAEVTEAEEASDSLDDLLDEIDAVLEENAEEFVKNYVQKGGQ